MLTLFSLVFATLVSEDLACITAGLLIQRGQLGVLSGVAACALGIFAGDVGLWGIARVFGRAALDLAWIKQCLESDRVYEFRSWLDRHAARTIIASRFLPGSRLPLYVIAGLVQLPGYVFASWALVGTLLWTPVLVLLTATLGDVFVTRISPVVGSSWAASAVTAGVIVSLVHGLRSSGSRSNLLANSQKA
jgi:membrane protein DedA with SNARE-associated domain